MAALSVEEAGGLDALRRRAPEWQSLVADATHPDFFQTWEWVESWLEAFCEPRSLLTLFVRDGARLVAAVPLLQERPRCSPNGLGFSLATNRQSPRSALLHAVSAERVLGTVFSHLRESTGGPTILSVPYCAVGSSLFLGLHKAAGALGLAAVGHRVRRSPRLTITGTWTDYLGTRPSHVRTEWRRKRRRLEAAGRARLEVVADGDIGRALRDVFEVERHCWKQDEGTSLTADDRAGSFYARLASRCAERGWLRLHLLHIDGTPAAYVFGVAYRGAFLALKTSYDSRHRGASPGIVLALSALERAFADGLTSFDLLGDAARWKSEMANDATALENVCVYSRGILKCETCRMLEVRVRPFVTRHLPTLAAARRRVATWRRSRAGAADLPRSRRRK